MAERHRAAREREEGLEPDLGELSYASLLALVMSYSYGEVPPEVESALWASTARCSHGPHSVFAKVAKLCLESRGQGEHQGSDSEARRGETEQSGAPLREVRRPDHLRGAQCLRCSFK